jgi:branched-chain amino acid transport system substrate-binding protein
MADAHTAALKAMKIKVLNTVDTPTDAVTFGPLVVKALDQKPDGIILACNGEKAAKIIKELKNRGWKKMNHILVFSSADDPQLYATGGNDLNGVQVYNYINLDVSNPRWDAFKAAFAKDHDGMAPFSLSPNYYDALYMIKQAIEKTGVTGDPSKLAEERRKIADYCADIKNFKGLLFNWDMKDGIPTNKPTYIFEIQNGKKKMVKEVRP